MQEHEVVPVKTKQLVGVHCDRCKAEFRVGVGNDDMEIQEMLIVDFTGGYGSVFGDGTHMKGELCQACVKTVLGPFLRVAA